MLSFAAKLTRDPTYPKCHPFRGVLLASLQVGMLQCWAAATGEDNCWECPCASVVLRQRNSCVCRKLFQLARRQAVSKEIEGLFWLKRRELGILP